MDWYEMEAKYLVKIMWQGIQDVGQLLKFISICNYKGLSMLNAIPHGDLDSWKRKEVLVSLFFSFSNAGVSRSATVILGYLMHTERLTLEESMKILKEARPCVKPNEGFIRQLQDYQRQLGL